MTKHYRLLLVPLIVVAGLWLLGGGPGGASAMTGALGPTPQGGGGRRAQHPETGKLTFLGFDAGHSPNIPQARAAGPGVAPRGRAYLEVYGREFGLDDPANQLRLAGTRTLAGERASARFQQTHQGVPVFAGELLVNTDDAGNLTSISGEVSPGLTVDTSAQVSAQAALATALQGVAKYYDADGSDLEADSPELWIYDERLLRPSQRPAELVWRTEVRSTSAEPLRVLVLVNAIRGSISLHFNQIDTSWSVNVEGPQLQETGTPTEPPVEEPTASATPVPPDTSVPSDVPTDTAVPSDTPTDLPAVTDTPTEPAAETPTETPVASETPSETITETPAEGLPTQVLGFGGGSRWTYTANNTWDYPGTFLCDETNDPCTGTDSHADAAHRHAADAYDFYDDYHGRDSLNGAGLNLVSTVHFGVGYFNAFWDGTQMVYGDGGGFPLADDVVGHELTHGVTQYESNLLYFFESGAINESLSDVWGEFIDLTNGTGNDSSAVRWLMGEDITGLGAIRSMKNPPTYGDPDRMLSSNYYRGYSDNGGVHSNSGVNNKAAFLLADGGSFNGYTVAPLGIAKTAGIYYEAQTNLMAAGSGYFDLYYILYQACQNIIGGPEGVTAGDCLEVRDATNATEMNREPAAGFNPDAAACPVDATLDTVLFNDDLELGSTNWVSGVIDPDTIGMTNRWSRTTSAYVPISWFLEPYAHSGSYFFYADDYPDETTDTYVAMKSDVLLPESAYLRFAHAYWFEYYGSPYYFDGGVVEYSTDSGVNWTDAEDLFDDGQDYPGTIFLYDGGGNPLAGRSAFVGETTGWVSSRYNLSDLAGQNVRFRWRMGLDYTGYSFGWYLDDIEINVCISPAAIPALAAPANNALVTTYTPVLTWAEDPREVDHYQVQLATDAGFTSIVQDADVSDPSYMASPALNPNTTYWWRVRGYNLYLEPNNWSSRSFRTVMLTPALVSPADTASLLTTRPTFDWNPVAGKSNYTLQVSTVSNFATTVLNVTPTLDQYTMSVDLNPKGQTLYWRVRANGTNGPTDYSPTRSLTSANPPSVPVLMSPASNALQMTYTPLLDWGDSTGSPTGYDVEVSRNIGFTDLADSATEASSSHTTATLEAGKTFWWRVRSVNAATEKSQWSAVRTFRTLLAAPALVSPADTASMLTTRPTFNWDPVTGASNYTLQISTVNTFVTTVMSVSSTPDQYTMTADLNPKGSTLYWHVRANGTNGPSAYSVTRSLTSANPPSVPLLVSPASGALVPSLTPTLDWGDSTGSPTGYDVEVSRNVGFTDLAESATEASSSHTTVTLDPGRTYWWRVRSVNAATEKSQWSAIRTLRTLLAAPALVTPADTASLLTTRPMFDWNPVVGKSNYTLQVSTVNTFVTTVLSVSSTPDQYQMTADLNPKGQTLYWRVKANGTNGPSLWSVTRSLTSANPPSVPVLVSPASNALVPSLTPTLTWGISTGSPTGYDVEVSRNIGFTDLADSATEVSPSHTTVTLDPGRTYWWRVRSVNAATEKSQWSAVRTLRTLLAAPALVTPADTASLLTTRPMFDWNPVVGKSNYTLQVSTVDTFVTTVLNVSSTPDQYQMTVDLNPKGATLFWHVRANGTNGPSAWSVTRSLTSANPPSVPVLALPASNALVLTLTPTLTWGASTGSPTGYDVEVSRNVGFTDLAESATEVSSSHTTVTLVGGRTYWWRVRSVNAATEKSQWSAVRTFRTGMLVPVLSSPTNGSTSTSLRPTFDWSDVSGATSYTIQVSTNNLFTTFVANVSPALSTFVPTSNLPAGKVFDWRVRANGTNGPGNWSPVWSFIVIP